MHVILLQNKLNWTELNPAGSSPTPAVCWGGDVAAPIYLGNQ